MAKRQPNVRESQRVSLQRTERGIIPHRREGCEQSSHAITVIFSKMGSIGCEQSPNQYCALSAEPNHPNCIIMHANGSQMVKMNITIELDDNDISLTDLLSAILHKEHVPVKVVPVKPAVEAPVKTKEEKPTLATPVKQEEVKPTKERGRRKSTKKYTCRICQSTETPQWRETKMKEGPSCNRCYQRKVRDAKANTVAPVVKVEEEKKAVSKPPTHPKPLRGRPARQLTPRKNTKENRRPELRDIGGLVSKDRVALLKASKFNTVRRFAMAHPNNLMLVMGCSLGEYSALENAQRKAHALHRKYSMQSSTVAKVAEKKKVEKPKWSDSKLFATVWNGIEGRETGAYMLSDVVEKAFTMASQNYEDTPKPKKFRKQLYKTGQDLFAKIVEAAKSPSFSILGTDEYTALLVLSTKGWPTLRDIEA